MGSPIPKTIHFIWIQGRKEIPHDRENIIGLWEEQNKDYEIKFWSGEDFLSDCDDKEVKEFYENLDMPVKQSDLARMWILSKYGGWYVDADLFPRRSLSNFLSDDMCVGRLEDGHSEPINYNKYNYILTREYRPIDRFRSSVANGIIGTVPSKMWMEFAMSRKTMGHLQVLQAIGPHALTRYLREIIDTIKGETIIIPPKYFLWERAAHGQPKNYCVAEHPGKNTWGDPTRREWWKV